MVEIERLILIGGNEFHNLVYISMQFCTCVNCACNNLWESL